MVASSRSFSVILAWPLAIVYWILRLMAWGFGVMVDWLTLGRRDAADR